jgi:hypothetical protein
MNRCAPFCACVLAVTCMSVSVMAVDRAYDLGHPGWTIYVDRDAATAVDYPAAIFSVDAGDPTRGTGKEFRTSDGRAKLTIYTLANAERDRPRSYLKHHLLIGPGDVEYRRVTRRFFALSGVHDGEVFYSRCNFSRDRHRTMRCIFVQYPEEEIKAWDRVITRISLSLRPANTSEP